MITHIIPYFARFFKRINDFLTKSFPIKNYVTSQSNFHLSPKTGSYSQTTNYARIKSETFREEVPHAEKTKTSHSRRPY